MDPTRSYPQPPLRSSAPKAAAAVTEHKAERQEVGSLYKQQRPRKCPFDWQKRSAHFRRVTAPAE